MPTQSYIDAHWETQPHRAGFPFCQLLKIEGHPFSYGSIVQVGAPMFPRYQCEAHVCDKDGVKRPFFIGEEGSLAEAKATVEKWHSTVLETLSDPAEWQADYRRDAA